MSPVLQALNPWFDEYAVKPLSYVNPVAVSDAAAPGQAVAVAPPAAAADPICGEMLSKPQMPAGAVSSSLPCVQTPARGGESDPAVMLDYAPAGPTHAQQLAEIERLLRLNDTSCEKSLVEIAAEEDDVPLFLRQVRRA